MPQGHLPTRLLSTLKRAWPLLPILVLTLFPFGWLGRACPLFGYWFNRFFHGVWVHAIAHFGIFLSLGLTLLLLFPRLLDRPKRYIGLAIWAGVAQEIIQLAYKQRPLVFDEFWDLWIDLLGLLAAYGLMRLWPRDPQESQN
jgi:hypothetical protein